MFHAKPFGRQPDPSSNRSLFLAAGLGRSGPGLGDALRDTGHDVRIFNRTSSARRELTRVFPDTVLVGPEEGPAASASLLDEARTRGVAVVLALLAHASSEAVDEALAAGAHDVVMPPHSVRSVLLRRRILLQHPSIELSMGSLQRRVSLGSLTVDLTNRQVLDGAAPLTLSGREFELLVRLMEARGDVVSRTCLLTDIWGEGQGSEAVLDATVHRLRRKLDEKLDAEQLIATVRGVGYRLLTHVRGVATAHA